MRRLLVLACALLPTLAVAQPYNPIVDFTRSNYLLRDLSNLSQGQALSLTGPVTFTGGLTNTIRYNFDLGTASATVTTGLSADPFANSLSERREGSGQIMRARTYGPYGNGVVRSAINTSQTIQNSREGVNSGVENPATIANYPYFDSVLDYTDESALTPVLILSGVTYTPTTIQLATPMTQTQMNLLRKVMWVTTNTNPQYGSWVSDFTATAITVAGWYVPGGGNAAAGQVPTSTLASGETTTRVFFGAATNLFTGNDRLTFNPSSQPDSQVQAMTWREVNLSNRGPAGFLYAQGLVMALDGNAPSASSYALRATGPWPTGLQIDGITGQQIKASGFSVDNLGTTRVSGSTLVSTSNTGGTEIAWNSLIPGGGISEFRNYRGGGSGGFDFATYGTTGTFLGGLNFYGDGSVVPKLGTSTIGTYASRWAILYGTKINTTPTTPTSSSAACTLGDQVADASYIYVCTATNTWKRAALSTF